MHKLYWLFFVAILITSGSLFAQKQPKKPTETFDTFINKIKIYAIQSGVSSVTVENAFRSINPNQTVINLSNSQPEFSLSFGKYLSTRLSKNRIKQGKKQFKIHQNKLYQAQQKYGVPSSILVALWGLESNYSKNTGSFNVVEALTNLAYAGRRQKLFSSELIWALHLLDKQKIPNPATSSWAGAMGSMQFMPSNIYINSKDANNNGLDLWQDLDDIFNSGAYFLKRIGWHKGQKWGREVILPKEFDYQQASLNNKQLLKFWNKLGVRSITNEPLPKSQLLGSIILPSGHQGPAFLVYRNFHAILNWNRSIFYALSVGLLANEIAYNQTLHIRPKITPSLTHLNIKKAQQKLIELGFLKDKADGIIGAKTRAALRKFQQLVNQPADGYLNQEMTEFLDF